jgi:two-component system nitrogen regulation response regulator GlnG
MTPACPFDTATSNDTPLVVIAEDNAELRALLAGALQRDGFRVAQAATGARLVALVEDLLESGEALHLVITDVRMPDASGLDAARALLDAGHRVPLILMTAYSDSWTRSRAAELGAILLDKPLSLTTLRREVRRAVDGLAAR